MKPEEINVVVLGASNKPERYSNMAVKLLKEKGYNVIPIHPLLDEIEGFPVVHYLKDVLDNIHSLIL
jgi:predicted CoA-binding protein